VEHEIGVLDDRLMQRIEAGIVGRREVARLRGATGQREAESGDRGENDRARHDRVLSGAGGHQKLKPGWAAAWRAGACGGGAAAAVTSRVGADGAGAAGVAAPTETPGATV